MALQRTLSSRYAWDENHRVFSKVTNQECPAKIGCPALNFQSQSLPQSRRCDSEENPEKALNQNNEMKQLPLPPPSLKVLNTSKTVKGLKQDPFLLAYKQCTKSRGSSSFKRLFTGFFTRNKKEKKKDAGEIGSEFLKRSDSEFSFQNSRVDVLPRDKSRRPLRSMSIK